MNKLSAGCLGLVLVGGVALADDAKPPPPTKQQGQEKVDSAKAETCEKGKKFLGDQKAKGKCAAEADEAAKLTCSAATFKQMNDLLSKCTSAKPAADAKAEPAPAATPKCRAVDKADATKVLAEAEDKLATKCTRLLTDKVKEAKCADAAAKGVTQEWVVQFDHMIGKTKMKDGKGSITCPKK